MDDEQAWNDGRGEGSSDASGKTKRLRSASYSHQMSKTSGRAGWTPTATFWLAALMPFAALTGAAVSFVHRSPAAISMRHADLRGAELRDAVAAAGLLWLPALAQVRGDAAGPAEVHNGRAVYVDGIAAVVFSIDSDQDELSRAIVEHFAATGWRQRRMQYLNPSVATSFEQGWQDHGGGVAFNHRAHSGPPQPYRRWQGEWEDSGGNLITYHLGGQGRRLHGYASYTPRPVLVEIRRKARSLRLTPGGPHPNGY